LRVPAEDLADCTEVSFEDWVGISAPIDTQDIMLYPNPASDQVELIIDRPGSHQITVLSATGQVIEAFQTTAVLERLDVSTWSPGIYFVNVAQGDESTVVRLAVQ